MTEVAKTNNDLWIGEFDQVATDPGPQTVEDAISGVDDLSPMIVSNLPETHADAAPPEQVDDPPTPPAEDEPQVYEYDDGSRVEIKKTKKGWRATLDSGTGANPEVFYGSTKDEMFANLAVGKINATRKIRELSRQPSLSEDDVPSPQVQEPQPTAPVRLTDNDVFDIKAKLEENPDLAFSTWFQKKTGMSVEDLVNLTKTAAQKSDQAADTSEDIAIAQLLKDWVDITDDYVANPTNRELLLSWLLKYKARQNPKNYNVQTALSYLYRNGHLTTENLDMAWEDVKSEGHAELPRAPEPEPEPEPVKPQVRRRPAAGLGIRSSEARPAAVRTTPVEEEKPLEQLTLAETEKILSDLRRLKAQNPAEYERLKAIGDAKRRGA